MDTFSRSRKIGRGLQLSAVSFQPSANPCLDDFRRVSPLFHSNAGEEIAEPRAKIHHGGTESRRNLRTHLSVTLWLRGGLSLYELPEHFFGIDRDEDTAAAGEDFALCVQDFGGIDVLPAVHADFPPLHP